jgi:hypothetical protein
VVIMVMTPFADHGVDQVGPQVGEIPDPFGRSVPDGVQLGLLAGGGSGSKWRRAVSGSGRRGAQPERAGRLMRVKCGTAVYAARR